METYEKRFKEVLAKAQEAITYLPDPALKKWLESVFPELKKSSFEDIRKAIIHLVNSSKETHFGIDNYDGVKWDEMLAWLEKQGKKPQGKSIIEAWKDMRLEVYQQASGNRHEPNCSDDNTKMFSLNDIDEIIEKINENY